jgi:hypothetical protein
MLLLNCFCKVTQRIQGIKINPILKTVFSTPALGSLIPALLICLYPARRSRNRLSAIRMFMPPNAFPEKTNPLDCLEGAPET